MAFDWNRGDITYVLHAYKVNPKTLGGITGELTGVQGGKLSLDYYSDTKASATLETANAGDDGWDGTSAIRLIYEVFDSNREHTYEGVLFTGYVKGLDINDDRGMKVKKYDLGSALWALSEDYVDGYVLPTGRSILYAINDLLWKKGGRANAVEPGTKDAVARGVKFYDPGTSVLSILYDLCDIGNMQPVMLEGGTISIGNYMKPSDRGADFDAGNDSTRGNVIPPIKTSDAMVELSSSALVYSKKNDLFVTGRAERTGNRAAAAVRGYRKVEKNNVNELNPFTSAQAAAVARQMLDKDVAEMEMSHGLMFRPLRVGAIEQFWKNNRATRWLIKSADLDMGVGSWIWDLDLKGGWA